MYTYVPVEARRGLGAGVAGSCEPPTCVELGLMRPLEEKQVMHASFGAAAPARAKDSP